MPAGVAQHLLAGVKRLDSVDLLPQRQRIPRRRRQPGNVSGRSCGDHGVSLSFVKSRMRYRAAYIIGQCA